VKEGFDQETGQSGETRATNGKMTSDDGRTLSANSINDQSMLRSGNDFN
jgi:hypothetical protein